MNYFHVKVESFTYCNKAKKEEGVIEMPTEKESVEIVETSIKGLDLIGKKITHERRGEGVVVGYSSVSVSPFAFFYDKGRVVCVDECEITSIQ